MYLHPLIYLYLFYKTMHKYFIIFYYDSINERLYLCANIDNVGKEQVVRYL